MLYQEALHNFLFLSRANSLITIGDRRRQKLAATFEKLNQQIHFCFHANGYPFMWGAYFYIGAYKWDVVVVIEMGDIHVVLIF